MNPEELKAQINQQLKSIILFLTVLPPEHKFCKLVKEFADSTPESDENTIFNAYVDTFSNPKNSLSERLKDVANETFDSLKDADKELVEQCLQKIINS